MESLSDLCGAIQERYRQRQDLLRAEMRLTLQIKSICRRFVKGELTEATKLYDSIERGGSHALRNAAEAVTQTLWQARAGIRDARRSLDSQLERDAKSLPIWPRVQATMGLGPMAIASLIGETGNLNNYPTHSKLWKRLGLAVINGVRQRRLSGPEALLHGYSPGRRSVVWNIGNNMLRTQSARVQSKLFSARPAGRFRLGYDARKEYELLQGLTKMHAHNRAKRYMEKKLVRNIWRAWREQPATHDIPEEAKTSPGSPV